MGKVAKFRILTVCAANQCRSRLAELLLLNQLGPLGDQFEVRSAGVDDLDPSPMCPVAVTYARERGVEPGDFALTAAKQINLDEIESADLILAADREIRTQLLRVAPQARDRVYTLRGAAAAAQLMNAESLVARARDAYAAGAKGVVRLEDEQEVLLAAALAPDRKHLTLWLLAELEAAHGRAMTEPENLDIPDAHHSSWTRRHNNTLRLVDRATVPLAILLAELLGTNRPVSS